MKHMASRVSLRSIITASVLATPLVLAILVPILLAQSVDYRDSDFFSFWLASKLVLHGLSPYSQSTWILGHDVAGAAWISDSTFLYPLPLAILLAPLGALRLSDAFFAWLILSVLITICSVIWISRSGRHTPWNLTLPLLAAVFVFRPTLGSLINGQVSALLLGLTTLALMLFRSRKSLAGGVALSFLLLKPSLGMPIVVIAGVWFLVAKRWAAIAGVCLGGLILLTVGCVVNPRWVHELSMIGSAKLEASIGYSPTLWGLFGMFAGESSRYYLPLGLTASIILGACVVAYCQRLPYEGMEDMALSAVVAGSLLVTPYLWTYDLLLLVAPMTVLVSLSHRSYPYLLLVAAPLAFSVVSLVLLKVAEVIGRDTWSLLLAGVILVLILVLGSRRSTRFSFAAQQLADADPAGGRESG